jgi:ankyrin repeat protein
VKLALFDLIRVGDTHGVCQLLDTDHGLLETRINGRTPLVFAVQRGRVDVAEVLIQRGADVEATHGDGWTALHDAVDRVNTDEAAALVRLLIRSGADVMARTTLMGHTALMWAVYMRTRAWGRTPVVVELLLEQMRGRGLEWRDSMGKTALQRACERGDLEKVRVLLYHGADYGAADERGRTPRMVVASGRSPHRAAIIKVFTVSG